MQLTREQSAILANNRNAKGKSKGERIETDVSSIHTKNSRINTIQQDHGVYEELKTIDDNVSRPSLSKSPSKIAESRPSIKLKQYSPRVEHSDGESKTKEANLAANEERKVSPHIRKPDVTQGDEESKHRTPLYSNSNQSKE